MKKNTKKRRTIRRLLIATAFALLMIPASVSADVVGKKITQEYTPNKQNPLSKIEYTYRSDGKFDMVLTFDIFAAQYAVYHVDNARDYVLEIRSKTQSNQLIGSQIINSSDIRKLNGKLVYDFKNAQKVPIVRPEEELSISFEFFSDYNNDQYANYGSNFQPRTVRAPEAPTSSPDCFREPPGTTPFTPFDTRMAWNTITGTDITTPYAPRISKHRASPL